MVSKIALVASSLTIIGSVSAFGVGAPSRPSLIGGSSTSTRFHLSAVSDDTKVEKSESDQDETFFSSQSAAPTIYDKLGFSKDQIALGVDEKEMLQWLGNRDDLIEKFQRDNKPFTPEKAAEEVDKFVMDAEMVNAFIAFEKKKADPEYARKQMEADLSDPSIFLIYGAWIVGGAGFAYFKNNIAGPKFASGEWEEIHFQLPDFFNKGGGDAATQAVSDAVSDAVTQSPALGEVAATVNEVVQQSAGGF